MNQFGIGKHETSQIPIDEEEIEVEMYKSFFASKVFVKLLFRTS